jgi:hypothetical protein
LDFIESDIFDPYTIDDEEYEYDILLQKRKGCDNKVDVKSMNMIFYCRKEKVVIIRLM